jgi:hypothetical protein
LDLVHSCIKEFPEQVGNEIYREKGEEKEEREEKGERGRE